MIVSVIIPFRKKNSKVINCIKSVKKQKYKKIEIITLSDKSKLEINGLKSYLNPKWTGAGEKRNFGVKKSKGDILFFLDSDCILKEDAIEKLVDLFKKLDVHAISGKTLAPKHGNLLGTVTGWEYEDRFNQMGEGYVSVAATTCLGVLKDAFEDVGGFQDYSRGEATGEDWDFSTRLVLKGYKIYHTNKVLVTHEHGDESLGHWFKRRIQHSKYRIVHKKKYGKLADEYSSWKMLISTTFLFCIPVVIRMFPKVRDIRIFSLPFFAFLRNIAWSVGMISGWIESRRIS
ncbi:MAG: glycosyltransferase [Candidatus Aenigmarchaeota archaeon]|nr:glycosyltransferase [Candidatus Aenigmarchaeota archaeon]